MRIAITGSSGFIGTALTASLRAAGHQVIRLVRRKPLAADEVAWDPVAGRLDPADLAGTEAVVNLAGASVGSRWTSHVKQGLVDSRIRSTTVLSSTMAAMDRPPRVLVSMSGMNAYGIDRGHDVIDEDDLPGNGFLPDLCTQWESATAPARAAGIAVCLPRLGIVMDRGGGAMARMLPLFRLGLGGRLGDGDQYWSHVSLTDVVRALRFLVEEHGCVGVYNLTAPQPVPNAEFSRVLADALRRPALVPVPAFALQLVIGEYAEVVLGSLRVVPSRLVDAGFEFRHRNAPAVVAAALT